MGMGMMGMEMGIAMRKMDMLNGCNAMEWMYYVTDAVLV
jgi:hypothetical protein